MSKTPDVASADTWEAGIDVAARWANSLCSDAGYSCPWAFHLIAQPAPSRAFIVKLLEGKGYLTVNVDQQPLPASDTLKRAFAKRIAESTFDVQAPAEVTQDPRFDFVTALHNFSIDATSSTSVDTHGNGQRIISNVLVYTQTWESALQHIKGWAAVRACSPPLQIVGPRASDQGEFLGVICKVNGTESQPSGLEFHIVRVGSQEHMPHPGTICARIRRDWPERWRSTNAMAESVREGNSLHMTNDQLQSSLRSLDPSIAVNSEDWVFGCTDGITSVLSLI